MAPTITAKQNDNRKATTLRFSVELHRRMKMAAAERGVSLESLVENAVKLHLGPSKKTAKTYEQEGKNQ